LKSGKESEKIQPNRKKSPKKEHFLLPFSLFFHCATVENIVQKQEFKNGIFYFKIFLSKIINFAARKLKTESPD